MLFRSWTQGGTNGVVGNRQMRDLGTLPGGEYSDAYAVNASGRVTGYSANASGVDRAFIWNSGTMTDLGALVQTGIGKSWSYGYSINATGQVVGTVGGAGTPEGPHIEFQVRAPQDGAPTAQDPLVWLRQRSTR